MVDKPIWKVSYHAGEMFALVAAATPDAAVEIAKAHRRAKHVWKGTPPVSLDADAYSVETPTEHDIRWCHNCRVGIQTGMPSRSRRKGAPARARNLRAIRVPQDVELVDEAVLQAA